MTTWGKHETALRELWENNAGNLTVDMVMGYLYEQGMLASQLEPLVRQGVPQPVGHCKDCKHWDDVTKGCEEDDLFGCIELISSPHRDGTFGCIKFDSKKGGSEMAKEYPYDEEWMNAPMGKPDSRLYEGYYIGIDASIKLLTDLLKDGKIDMIGINIEEIRERLNSLSRNIKIYTRK